MFRLAVRQLAPRVPITRRYISSSSSLRSASPEWQELIGGREGVERKRKAYEGKYAAAMEAKAKAEGLTVEELKRRQNVVEARKKAAEAEARALRQTPPPQDTTGPVPAGSEGALVQGQGTRPLPSAESDTARAARSFTKPKDAKDSPVKPLHSIMDLSKAAQLDSSAIAQLWTTYHQAKGFLSAAIPTATYERMVKSGKQYPIFVLPLARDVVGELPDGSEAPSAVEMHLLEWAFLPPPSTVTEPVPPPSTVLFTPLAEYKARQTYAQPYLILTHYTDLAASHNLVLMRGDISDNVALDQVHAQVLAVRMQMFYNDTGIGGDKEAERRELLRLFHEKPEEFDVQRLIKSGEISAI